MNYGGLIRRSDKRFSGKGINTNRTGGHISDPCDGTLGDKRRKAMAHRDGCKDYRVFRMADSPIHKIHCSLPHRE